MYPINLEKLLFIILQLLLLPYFLSSLLWNFNTHILHLLTILLCLILTTGIPALQKFSCLIPLCFWESPVLAPVFINQNNSEEDFQLLLKKLIASSFYTILAQKVLVGILYFQIPVDLIFYFLHLYNYVLQSRIFFSLISASLILQLSLIYY